MATGHSSAPGRPHGASTSSRSPEPSTRRRGPGRREAFRTTRGKPLDGEAHVDGKGFEAGVDTIFLLSDGTPNEGVYGAWDRMDELTTSGQTQPGLVRRRGRQEFRRFLCPYRWGRVLVRDLRRLNLFRRVEIHCFGTGEADEHLLRQIAEVGAGTVRILGATPR